MKLNSKVRKISGLFMIMLVIGMILVTPAMACPAGTPCGSTASGVEKKEITGMEKYEKIAFALNLKDVQKLSGSPSATDLKQIEDGAKVYSIEKTLEDGSADYVTGVILPVEVIAEDNISVQISNVFVIWSGEKPAQVMSATQIFEDKTLKELTLNRVGDDGEILNTQVVDNGAFNLFLGSNMKRWKILIICIIMGLIFIPAVSAEEEYTVNSDTEDTFTSAGKDYIISPWVENSSDAENPIFSVLSTQYITQGQTKTHYVSVGSGINYLEVDLNWGDTSDSLTLRISTPSGSNLGPYRDNSDGSVNGRIHFSIDPSQGYVEQGSWEFKVYGESVSGTEDYTFNLYQH